MSTAPQYCATSCYSAADIARFKQLFLPQQPRRISRMLGHDAAEKYKDTTAPINIAAHLDGSETWAASFINCDGLAQALGCDVDSGGMDALVALLAALQRRGIVAFAVTSKNDEQGHDGGHIIALYTQRFIPDRGKALMVEVATAAGVAIEPYPSGQVLRLPFGKHTWTGKRGMLIFQDGSTINLDTGPEAIRLGLAAIDALPRNSVEGLPPLEQPRPQPPAPHLKAQQTGSIIEQFNQQHDLISLFKGYGGKVAKQYPGGGALMHCPCGRHAHGDRHPSLAITPAKKSQYGKLVAHGYSQNCAFYTDTGKVIDAFSIFCFFEHLTPAEAVKKLAPAQAQPRRQHAQPIPDPEPTPPRRIPPATERRRRKHERQERTAAAHITQAEIRTRAEADTNLSPRAYDTLIALLTSAGPDQDWCRPSVARLAEMIGRSEATIHRALTELKNHGYIEDDPGTARGGHGTTIRRFLRVSQVDIIQGQPDTLCHAVAPELSIKLDLNASPELACKRGGVTLASAPHPPAEPVIAFEGGASYAPVALPSEPPAREWRSNLPPKEFYTAFVAPRERRERQHEQLRPVLQPVAPPAEQHEMEIAVTGPSRVPLLIQPPEAPQPTSKRRRRRATGKELAQPDDPQILADKYGRLLGKARKVERANPKQAAALRGEAAVIKKQLNALPLPIEAAIEAVPALEGQAKGEPPPRLQASPVEPLVELGYVEGVRRMAHHGGWESQAVYDYLQAKGVPSALYGVYIAAARGATGAGDPAST